MDFPCRFPIKVIGSNNSLFQTHVAAIAKKHYPELPIDSIQSQQSQGGQYVSMTIIVDAFDQSTLDALYIELTQHPDVKMVL